jgi:hypothetical protein
VSAAPVSPVAVPTRTGRRPWSTMLLREWAAKAYPGLPLLEQYRLGPTTAALVGVTVTPGLEAALRVNNWYADGVIYAPNETLLIEAKMKPNPSAVGQVLFYLRLLPSTPEHNQKPFAPLVAVVLFAEDDATVRVFAQSLAVRVVTYTPSWVEDYLNQVQFRSRQRSLEGASDTTGPAESTPGASAGS